MLRLSALLQHLGLGLLLLGSLGMMLSMILGTADVVGTSFFGRPVPGALEVTESTMVLIVFGALAYSQVKRAHIRVELLYGLLGYRLQCFVDALGHLIAFVFFALITWQALGEARYSWGINEATLGTIRLPLYPARWLLVIGTTLMLAQLVLDMITDLQRMRRGEPPKVKPQDPRVLRAA